jgi:CAP-Gly domain
MGSNSEGNFQLNDPVHVHREGSSAQNKLEGVISFLGSVEFADGDDWVGVRLTGSSVGLGRNDGTVQGHKYFDCPTQCGLFVKQSAVKPRQLTRLEELRLRRELATSGGEGPSTSPSSTRTPARSRATGDSATATPSTTSRTRTPGTTTTASVAETPPSSLNPALTPKPAGAATNRLEEIRQRRAQLQQQQGGTAARTPTASTSSKAATKGTENTTTASSVRSGLSTSTASQKEVDELRSQLNSQADRIKSLQDDLDKAQTESSDKERQIKALQNELQQQASDPNSNSVADSPSDDSAAATAQKQQRHIEDLQHQIEILGTSMAQDAKKARGTMDEMQAKFQQAEVDLAASRALVENLQNELSQRDAASQQLEQRATADASHYKERAKLQAEVASLNRRVEQLELDKQELEHNVEELALDKEQLEEGKEQLEDRLEELKLDAETGAFYVQERYRWQRRNTHSLLLGDMV